jgi:hypothetical protein
MLNKIYHFLKEKLYNQSLQLIVFVKNLILFTYAIMCFMINVIPVK